MLVILKKIIQISLVLATVISVSSTVLAQESVYNSISSVYIIMEPNSPRAGESVVLTVASELLDITSSKINWYIDGASRRDSTNKSITIKVKSNGQKTTIRVVVETLDGIIKEATKEISPAGVDLVIEPLSYTLPFYKGKPFFIAEGTIKIAAIPDVIINGVKASTKNLNFRWFKGGSILSSNSGMGKNSIIVNGNVPIRDIDIRIEILDGTGTILAQNSKTIFVNEPKILFYENNPLYGVLYNRAITGNYFLGTREELKIDAKPFSFNFTSDTTSNASYVWYVNGNYIVPSGKTSQMLLRQTATNLKGTASISLDVKNKTKIFQYASGEFNVQFGE